MEFDYLYLAANRQRLIEEEFAGQPVDLRLQELYTLDTIRPADLPALHPNEWALELAGLEGLLS